MLAEQTRKAAVEVWAYCLMPNHVHLILTPTRADGPRSLSLFHARYSTNGDAELPIPSEAGRFSRPRYKTPSAYPSALADPSAFAPDDDPMQDERQERYRSRHCCGYLPFAPEPQMGRYFATFWVANEFYQSLAGPDGRML